MKVLIIDDEKFILSSLKRAFMQFKDEVIVYTSDTVKGAFEILEREEINAIVSDLNMPGEGGLKLLENLKEKRLNIPVIIMTGEPRADSAVQCMKTGAADYISKPIEAESLLKKLWDLCDCAKPWNRGYIIESYYLTELISETYASMVFLAGKFEDNRSYVIKALKSDEMISNTNSYKRFEREVATLSQLNHPNMIDVVDYGMTEHGIPYYVMPFIGGKELTSVLQELSLKRFINYMINVSNALNHLHMNKIIHRDIKPQNIIVNDEKAVLIDYGTVLTPDSNLTQDCSLLGTPNYMAPECFSDSHEISYKADYFSLGAIIYLYAYGKTPYSGKDVYATLKNILSIKEEDLFKGSIFDPLLKKLVVKSANSRLNNIESIKKELLAIEE